MNMQRPGVVALVLLVACALLVQHLCQAASTLDTYPLDWSTVPVTPNPNTSIQAGCVCKLLNGACTPNCCCDTDCPAAVVAAYETDGACLPAGPPPDQLDYCVPADPFAKVNLPSGNYYRIQKVQAGEDFLTQLLCIAGDNNPSLGSTYLDPEVGDAGTNAQQAACASRLSAPTPSNHYSVGVPVVASYGTLRANFSVPQPALSTECVDGMQLGFLSRVPTSLQSTSAPCERTIAAAAFAATCPSATSPLSPTYYSSMTFPTGPTASGGVAVTVAGITRADPVTGVLSAMAGAPVAPTWTAATLTCAGVVTAASYTFTYTMDTAGAAALTAVSLQLTVSDVAQAAAGSMVVVRQAFGVQWAPQSAAAAALRANSGSPGYLTGFPVLAGVLQQQVSGTTTLSAVSRWELGLPLPAAKPDGSCSPAAPPTAVGFGYNGSSSCMSGSMTLAQLGTFCTGDSNAAISAALGDLFVDLTGGKAYVGVWGNSAYNNTAEWVQLAPSGLNAGATMTWDAASGTCSGVVTGFDVTLLTGLAYSTSNLQSKVLFARVCFRYGSWRFDGSQPATSAQPFPLTFTASFVPAAQGDAVPARKPPPPLVLPLNPDLFYPFLVGDSNAAAVQAPSVLGALVAVGSVLGLLLL